MKEKTIFKPSEVEGKTRLKLDEVIDIAKKSIANMEVKYELITEKVLYDTVSHITKEPVWYVDIIAILHKERFPDAFEILAISDITGKAIYIMNDHGVAHNI
ncbi:hypothetical protein JHL18_15010 [Clostridium sp. YIM B02505]|uniref:Uncharacterized protein n=1 Tax=Clostridium yunnanense TaxID=2800325 RepID=A0ABS1ERA9_9CLOT|nr:hypothetical protein [Clostridium yunnanense]MBK1811929.1 hypothetical protein [Clostridium yunnanense]